MADEINWFPGHMKKALRSVSEQIKWVDVVIETADARIPFSSRNPELDALIRNKPRVLVLNKADLADPQITSKWMETYKESDLSAVACDAIHKKGLNQLKIICKSLCSQIIEKSKEKGRIGRPIRAMVVGIPNSGKSTLINSLCNRKVAVTRDQPGVTRGFQWAKTGSDFELMDMPGILWPKLGTRKSQICLTMTGAVRMEIVNIQDVAIEAFSLLFSIYPKEMCSRFRLPPLESEDFPKDIYSIFLLAARKRGCLLSGDRVDEERFSNVFLEDYRSGRIGCLSLERP